MPIYTLGNAAMPTTDANVVSRDAVNQIQAAAAAGVVSPAAVQAAAAGSVSIGEQLAQQIAQPAPSRGGALNPSAFDAPQQRSYVSGCGVQMGRPVVPGTGFYAGGSDELTAVDALERGRRRKGLTYFAIAAAVAVGVLAASR